MVKEATSCIIIIKYESRIHSGYFCGISSILASLDA